MRRSIISVLVVLLASWVLAPLAVAQVSIGADASIWFFPVDPDLMHYSEDDNDTATVTAPGAGSVSAAVGPTGGSSVDSFAYAHAETSIGSSSISGYGHANAASNPSDGLAAWAQADLSYGFTVDCVTQAVLSYDLVRPSYPPVSSSPNVHTQLILLSNMNPIFYSAGSLPGQASGMHIMMLDPGDYELEAMAQVSTNVDIDGFPIATSPSPPAETSWQFTLEFRDGKSQDTAFLPITTTFAGGWVFSNLPGGNWYDPILADGFEFEMLDEGSFFTEAGMPVGLGDPNGYIINYFDGLTEVFVPVAEGENYIFPGAGVSSFKVLDIGPPFDPEDPLAFPIYLDFSTETASFSMTPILVPEPSSLALAGMGLLGVGALACRRRRRE